jgi:hypothetical protein
MKKPKLIFRFYKSSHFLWKPYFRKNGLIWKDKNNSPRVQLSPKILFEWLWFQFYIFKGDDKYWEQWLWLKKYSNNDLKKAKETWPWYDGKTKKSSWIDY